MFGLDKTLAINNFGLWNIYVDNVWDIGKSNTIEEMDEDTSIRKYIMLVKN